MFGRPYTIQRPQLGTPVSAAVTVSLDNGPEQAATLAGSSPSYAWTAPDIDATGLADGAHTLTARLYLNGSGQPASTHSVTFHVQRGPAEFTYDVLIGSPADGSVVPRATVEVRGTSSTDDPSSNRKVTLEVLGPEPAAEADATGTSPWTRNVDFNRTPGLYTLTARLYVDGAAKATHSVQVTVPPPSGDDVSCAGRSMGFWRQQFADGAARKFTGSEVETLAFHAVGLSDGYFASRDALVAALNAKGDEGAEARAARQFAALLLNLAGGDLSAGMSYQAGLSGGELLDPAVYDTATLGPTGELGEGLGPLAAAGRRPRRRERGRRRAQQRSRGHLRAESRPGPTGARAGRAPRRQSLPLRQICQAPAARRTGTRSPSRVMPSTSTSLLPIMKSTWMSLTFTRSRSASSSTGNVYALPSATWLAAFSSSRVS